jgi:hypothetical protein
MAAAPYRFLGINLVDKWISLRRIAGIIEPQYFPQMAALVLPLVIEQEKGVGNKMAQPNYGWLLGCRKI